VRDGVHLAVAEMIGEEAFSALALEGRHLRVASGVGHGRGHGVAARCVVSYQRVLQLAAQKGFPGGRPSRGRR